MSLRWKCVSLYIHKCQIVDIPVLLWGKYATIKQTPNKLQAAYLYVDDTLSFPCVLLALLPTYYNLLTYQQHSG